MLITQADLGQGALGPWKRWRSTVQPQQLPALVMGCLLGVANAWSGALT